MQIVFLLVALVTIISAVMVVSARRMMHAALWLILSLVGAAIIFAMLEAGFYVVVQVMVYVGAIAIMIVFAVMLTQREKEDEGPRVTKNWWLPLLLSLGVFVLLVISFGAFDGFQITERVVGGQDIAGLGEALVNPEGYLIPFEVASVLLLGAMIGSIYIALDRKGGK